MKKILSLVAFLMLMVSNAMAGEVFTYTLNGGKATSDPAGFFSYDTSGKFSFNSKFTGAEYDGVTYSNGLKLEGTTKILFTTTKESTVTLVQSNWSDKTIKFDGEEVSNRVEGTGCFIYTITGVAPGDHTVGRGSGEAGLFLVKVEYASVYSATFQNTANWDAVHAYAWSGEGDNVVKMLGEWPGKQLTADAEGNFPVTIEGDKPEKIIFNNGSGGDGNQTADFDFKDGGVYNYDGRIIKKTNYTAYFTTDAGWKKVYAYAWNADEEPLGEWPGTAMTYADDQWEITISAEEIPTKIIFHNNEGVQTPDLDFEAGKAYEFNLNTYTATFTTDAGWEDVYAWIWTGDKNLSTAEWPGDKLEAVDGVYTFTYKAFEAPANILFNGGDDTKKTYDMAFTNGRAYKWNTTLKPFFAFEEGGDAIPAGTTQEVKDADGAVVATVTYGVEGEADFAAPSARANEEYANFTVYTAGNGVNGSATAGTVYYIKPVYDGVMTIGVWLNGNKAFYIQEDGESLEGFDGFKQAYGSGTAFTIDVKANSTYTVYCTGSKLGFYGFDYTFDKPVVEEPVYTIVGGFNTTEGGQADVIFGKTWEPTIEANDMMKGENGLYTKSFNNVALEAGTIFYKVVKNHGWETNWGFGENNADYVVNEAGTYDITFTFNPDGNLENSEYQLGCALVKKANPFENVTITPAQGEVESLQEFVVTFGNATNAYRTYYDESDKPYLISADESFVEYGEFDYGTEFNEVVVRLAAEVNVSGQYTLVFPAGTITADGQTNAEKMEFSYVINAPKTFEVFLTNIPEGFGTPYAYAWSQDVENVTEFSKAWPGDKMQYVRDEETMAITGYRWQVDGKVAPQFIIFNNGNTEAMVQTADLAFEDKKTYDLSELLSEPAVELADLAALKAFEVEDNADVVLTLTDAKVTYVGTTESIDEDYAPVTVDVVVFEDASAGVMWQGSGLGKLVTAGQVLNGKLALNVTSVWGDVTVTLTNGLEGVTVEDGTVTPLILDDGNVMEYLGAPDWKLIKLKNVTFKVVSGEYTEETRLVSDLIGDEFAGLMDVIGNEVMPEDTESTYDVTGYVYSLHGGMITGFQPLSITKVTYYLAGNMNEWAISEDYKLVKNTEAETEEYYIVVNLAEGAQFKVVRYDDEWYPEGTGNAYGEASGTEIAEAGEYTVYFRPNGDGNDDWYSGFYYVEKGNAVGIKAVNAEIANGAAVYNMQGVRVQNAHRGLYIVNGKKVVVK